MIWGGEWMPHGWCVEGGGRVCSVIHQASITSSERDVPLRACLCVPGCLATRAYVCVCCAAAHLVTWLPCSLPAHLALFHSLAHLALFHPLAWPGRQSVLSATCRCRVLTCLITHCF